MDTKRLEEQLSFLREIDRAKKVVRRTLLLDGSRCENDAEHMWHMAVAAMVLGEYAGGDLAPNMLTVLRMILIHDIIEIDAGDTYAYDEAAHQDKAQREQKAADRIFPMLPDDQAREFRALWEYVRAMVDDAVKKGYLEDEKGPAVFR